LIKSLIVITGVLLMIIDFICVSLVLKDKPDVSVIRTKGV
jgi:hypothetical protein